MMLRFSFVIAVGLIVLAVVGFNLATVVVDEGSQVVITELGRPVRQLTEPGLYYKTPFIQQVHLFERRIISYDSSPQDVITRDKKTIHIDNYVRWRIDDPLTFLQAVGTERGAQSRLDDIIYSELRVELGRYDLLDIVSTSREQITADVTKRAAITTRAFGVEIIDVRLKRTDLPEANLKAVYDRMRSERQRQATQYRSEGAEESAKIKAQTEKDKTIILAEAYRKSQTLRGEGDAEAIRIYNDALNQDPEFYSFVRTLDAYRRTLGAGTRLVLTPDADFFRYLGRLPRDAAPLAAPATR